jgi:hypothetical protein
MKERVGQMTKRLVLLGLGGLIGVTLLLSACAPAMPHSFEGRSDCISCHGPKGVEPYTSWHAERGLDNGNCATCHQLAANIDR